MSFYWARLVHLFIADEYPVDLQRGMSEQHICRSQPDSLSIEPALIPCGLATGSGSLSREISRRKRKTECFNGTERVKVFSAS